jgi:coenzyme F420-reducing hydrogenase delta subunit
MLKIFLDYLGLEADRTTFTWCSASEGERFAKVVSGVTERVRQLGPAKKLVKSL